MSQIPASSLVRPTVEAVLPRYFSHRRGKLGPARTFLTLLHMRIFGQRGYRRVLGELKDGLSTHLGWLWDDKPSSAALCKARPKLTLEHCETAFRAIYQRCSLAREAPELSYHGRSIVALDGTRLALPDSKEIGDHFGYANNQHGTCGVPTASLMLMWDVGAQQPIAFKLAPYRESERESARSLFDQLPGNSMLLADRGFPSFEVLADLIDRKQPFVMRMRKKLNKNSDFFIEGDETDAVVTLTTPPKSLRLGHQQRSINVRLIKKERPDKDPLIIVTNCLKNDGHQADELLDLYINRWRIETAFREMKMWHALEEFSARHVLGIHQEVYAAFVFALLVSDFEARIRQEKAELSQKSPDQELPSIRFNRIMVADAVVGLLVAATAGEEQVLKHLDRCIETIWRNREKRRNRSAPRVRKKPLKGFKRQGKK